MIKIFLYVCLTQAMGFYLIENFFSKKAVSFVKQVW